MDEKEWVKRIADLDQGARAIVESIPPLLRGMYKGLLREGFNEAQAMRLTRDYLFVTFGGRNESGE